MREMNAKEDSREDVTGTPGREDFSRPLLGFVIALVLLSSVFTGWIIFRLGDLDEDSGNERELSQSLEMLIAEVREHQVQQHLALEKVCRINFEEPGEEEPDEEFFKFREKRLRTNIIAFKENGLLAEEKIGLGRELLDLARETFEGGFKNYELLSEQFEELQIRQILFQEQGKEFITTILEEETEEEAEEQFTTVEEQSLEIELRVDQLLTGIKLSGEAQRRAEDEQETDTIRTASTLALAEAGFTILLVGLMGYASYQYMGALKTRCDEAVPFRNENVVLRQEVHHRVKNNLQVVSSLLDFQSQSSNDQKVKDAFQESQNRIKSMSLVHDKVYQLKDMAHIDFADYVENLATYLFHNYKINKETIKLSVNVERVYLNVETAIPCGLVINELMVKSLKHAFPVNQEGEIHINFFSEGQNFVLEVGNNGVDFSDYLDSRDRTTLGINLINILTLQMGGTLAIDKGQGTRFRISFPRNEAVVEAGS